MVGYLFSQSFIGRQGSPYESGRRIGFKFIVRIKSEDVIFINIVPAPTTSRYQIYHPKCSVPGLGTTIRSSTVGKAHIKRVDLRSHPVPQSHFCETAFHLIKGSAPTSNRLIEIVKVVKLQAQTIY